LRYDGRRIGSAYPKRNGFDRTIAGYYWVTPDDGELGIPLRNTAGTPVADIETAKADCMAYVKGCMARKEG